MSYACLRQLVGLIVRLFFRHVDTVGSYHVPKEGPTIFVANHANQFVDPMMLIWNIPRVVRFLIAAKSLRKRIIGDLARMAQSIGVERPQDLVKKGSGTVSATAGATVLTGTGTSFTKDLKEGSKVKAGNVEVVMKSVESDTQCTISPCPEGFAVSAYKILPKVDQHAVYQQVHDALKAGDCIGIFPEGGSHDQAHMIDLKPGVAIMALGAMQAGAGQVKICPCGLNYFEPYRFRSRVVVEFGEPVVVPVELAKRYETDKRAAVQELMEMIERALKRVLPGANDYAEMQAIITMRALWKPHDRKITPEESLKITRTFAKGLQMFRDDERVAPIVRDVQAYNNALQAAGCKDRDVRMQLVSNSQRATRTIWAVVEVLVLLLPALVFYLIFTPVAFVTYVAAQREKKSALAGSSVKVKALDVVASHKIKVSLVIVPVYQFVLSVVVVCLTTGFTLIGFALLLGLSMLGWPVLTLVGARVCDQFQKSWMFCRTNFSCGRKTKTLLEERKRLQLSIRGLVEELAPQVVDDWTNKRIIQQHEIDKDNALSLSLIEPLLVPSDSQV